jgi:hypothetical protein
MAVLARCHCTWIHISYVLATLILLILSIVFFLGGLGVLGGSIGVLDLIGVLAS